MAKSNQPLFRIEPRLAGQQRECNAFNRSAATSAFLIYGLCVLISGGTAFAATQQLARKATISGRIELAEGELKLYVDSRRVVSSIRVQEGELVHEGQVLAVFKAQDHESSHLKTNKSPTHGFSALLASLSAERERLALSKTNANRETDSRRESLKAQKLIVKAALKNQRLEHKTLRKLQKMSSEQLERGKGLRQLEHLTQTKLEELQRLHTENALKLSRSLRDELSLQERLNTIDHQLETLNYKLRERLSNLNATQGQNDRELARLKMNMEMRLLAPTDGIITGLLGHKGATVEPNRPVITMIKNAAKFRARLWANSSSAGELKYGQQVSLMLDAFPHQKHGMLSGEIEHINESPLTLRELDAPWEGAGPAYAVTVDIDRTSTLYPQLKPGMNLTADIKLDQSLLAERLFEPLIKAWQRAL